MTITYPNGTILQAIVLSHDEEAIRVVAAGCADVLAFTSIHGTWISEELEPVKIEFERQRRRADPFPSVDDCVCPKELAARLIHSLFSGIEPRGVESDTLYIIDSAGERVAVDFSELGLQ